MTDTEYAERVASQVRRWVSAVDDAGSAILDAQRLRTELAGTDHEFDEAAESQAAKMFLAEAWSAVSRTRGIAADRLKLVEDAEKDAELARLRAEVASLRQSLDSARGTGA